MDNIPLPIVHPSKNGPILIIGGGIAGLYLRASLHARGQPTILVESSSLGCGQSIASQGILHRGIKYALSSKAAQASSSLAQAHDAWNANFAGTRAPNLGKVRVLAETMHFWTRPAGLLAAVTSSITGAAAALAMKSGVTKLARADYPADFADSPSTVHVWRVEERCIEVRSLLVALRDASTSPIVRGDGADLAALVGDFGARAVVLAAGIGNETLIRGLGVDPAPICQRRPLQMVIMRDGPSVFFGHCLQELSDKPRLTITSTTDRIWYIGGNVAETGVERSPQDQIRAAREELDACMPWVKFASSPENTAWSTLRVDRAEGRTLDGSRPDGPVIRRIESKLPVPVWAAWPTKLALAPALAADVETALEHESLLAPPTPDQMTPPSDSQAPFEVASAPWEK